MHTFKIFSTSILVALFWAAVNAQQPTPPMIVVPAAGAPAAASPPPATSSASSDAAISAAIKILEQTKAANDALLKRQEAMLQQLDELQKAAEQLKTFSKRV